MRPKSALLAAASWAAPRLISFPGWGSEWLSSRSDSRAERHRRRMRNHGGAEQGDRLGGVDPEEPGSLGAASPKSLGVMSASPGGAAIASPSRSKILRSSNGTWPGSRRLESRWRLSPAKSCARSSLSLAKVLAAGYCSRDSKPIRSRQRRLFSCGTEAGGALSDQRASGRYPGPGDNDFLVKTTAGDVRTPLIVNAANVWAGQIAEMVGYSLPVTMEIQMGMITNGGAVLFPYVFTTVKGNLTLKQELPSGRVIIGGGWNGTGDI
jgi:hypothetical protein